MISLDSELKIFVATQPIDFRKGVNGLVVLIADTLKSDPYAGHLYVFRSKRNDRLKMLRYDGSGVVLVTKWLEAGRFTWPPVQDGAMRLSAAKMALLLDGLDWSGVAQRPVKRPIKAG
jgi:transposase